jgi:WD40 repeat protein
LRDYELTLWDVTTGKAIGATLEFKGGSLIAYHPDGRTIAKREANNMVSLIDVATGKTIGSPLPHTAPVSRLVFGPEGKTLITATGETAGPAEVRVWDTTTGSLLGHIPAHDGPALALAVSPDGKTLLTANDKEARLWHMPANRP